jgi:hypothetical protein|tara:strand:- start:145 stop:246 length:102 start_codon:yes stop_codon:yes gene_type:complete
MVLNGTIRSGTTANPLARSVAVGENGIGFGDEL